MSLILKLNFIHLERFTQVAGCLNVFSRWPDSKLLPVTGNFIREVSWNHAKIQHGALCNNGCRLLAVSYSFRNSRLEVLCEKGVLRNFTKFTGKHLCQSLFFNKVAGLSVFL